MRFLFLHYAFPGPFRYLATYLASLPGNAVVFASEFDRSDLNLPGVRKFILNKPKPLARIHDPEKATATDLAERDICAAVRRGAATANSLLTLRREQGFVPDIIYASALMGAGFYVRDVFPEALLAVYADWYHTDEEHAAYSLRRSVSGLCYAQARVRNLVQINSLLECHLPVTAAACQRKHFPPGVSSRMQVMPRGVDTQFYFPGNGGCREKTAINEDLDLSSAGELVTFSGRIQESGRGLSYFLRALPRLFNTRPRCRALVLATGSEPDRVEELRREARDLLGQHADRARIVHFARLKEYRSILRASDLHVYLIAPHALSAGVFEAMSCACLVLGVDTEPVREVIRHGENGFLHDFTDYQATADIMADLLDRAPALEPVRQAARHTIVTCYEQRELVRRHEAMLGRCHQAWLRDDPLLGLPLVE
ncbi:MAG: glycosyltransferase [Deltaproteobacteria bacterium]|jgi:glycosyltransferase involved in cell wall biosynthesis|nr:glycosyltransferase [Deltaproteobacteria bacterium]